MSSLEEYFKWKDNMVAVETIEEFKEFCKNNYCFYEYGFGYSIVQTITTEEEFIEFMLKCAVVNIYNGFDLPFFMNDYSFEYLDINKEYVEGDGDYDGGYEYNDDDFHKITAYSIMYNSYSDKPFEFHKVNGFKKMKSSLFTVKPEIKNKFPAVVKCHSEDTFDRMGDVKGCNIEIFPLKDINTMVFI